MSSRTERYEKFSFIFLVAGLFFLIIAFLALAVAPISQVRNLDDKEKLGMPKEIPAEFKQYYSSLDAYHEGLLNAKHIYVKEACWHCHSQYVRPVSNESLRYGPISQPGEYENDLNYPQVFGTRRVGPDLSRESGKHTNDWHFAHFYNPKWTVPQTVMPPFPWYFTVKNKQGEIVEQADLNNPDLVIEPKQDAIDLVAYMQWLGHQVADVGPDYDPDAIIMPPTK